MVRLYTFCRQTKLTFYSTFEEDKKPIEAAFSDTPNIPRRPKKPQPVESNGNGEINGKAANAEPKGVKRPHADDGNPPLKKLKISDSSTEIVDVDEDQDRVNGGAIVIDD
jgi:ubiquitin-like 1-activating enzyme E1 B